MFVALRAWGLDLRDHELRVEAEPIKELPKGSLVDLQMGKGREAIECISRCSLELRALRLRLRAPSSGP